MTGKERLAKALRFEQPERPPHFEIAFELTPEAFGMEFPSGKEWATASGVARARLLDRSMELYRRIVAAYQWDAVVVLNPAQEPEGVAAAKRAFGDELAVGGIVWEGVWSIDIIKDWERFAEDLAENPNALLDRAEKFCEAGLRRIDAQAQAGADFLFIASDVGFNAGPFVSPIQFRRLVTPYLARLVARVREYGKWAFFHSDGQLMPVLDQILECRPHALQSIDPQAGMDFAEVKRRAYGRMALMGNVACNLLQQGPEEAIRRSARYCLTHGAPGGGYVFSSSNTIFRGVPLRNYECMLGSFHEFNALHTGAAEEDGR